MCVLFCCCFGGGDDVGGGGGSGGGRAFEVMLSFQTLYLFKVLSIFSEST